MTYKSKLTISLIVWNICLSSFYFGYCIVYLGQIKTETLQDLFSIDISIGTTEGILNGCIPIGALIGALSSSFFIAKFSRRKCLLMMNAFAFTVGALIYIQTFPTLVIFRLCQGFCVGFYSSIAPLIIKELSPNEISGTLGSYAQLNICLGVFTGCIFTYILKKATGDETCKDFWYIIFGLPEITIAIQTVALLFIFPYETPRYLLSVGKEG